MFSVRDTLVHCISDVQVYQNLIDRSRATPLKRDAKVKVIGAGFARTATLSMYTALGELGYKCYHGLELEAGPGVVEKWLKVLEHDMAKGNAGGINWAEVLEGYDAGLDSPCCDYWLELSRAYPDAKIIYTHRDGKNWVESYKTAIIGPMNKSIWFALASFWFPRQGKIRKVARLVQDKYVRDFGGLGLHPDLMDKRLEAIRKEISPERLLVFHPSQGWEPLCRFLGEPIPDTPFPRINDGPSMVWTLRAISIAGMILWMIALATLVAGVTYLYARMA